MGKGKKKRNNEKAAAEKKAAPGPVEQPQPEESDPSSLERPLEAARLTEPEKEKSCPKSSPVMTVGSSIEPSVTNYELSVPRRGGPGREGRQGTQLLVHVNHFPMKISGQKRVNHYHLDVTAPWRRPNKRSDEPLFRRALDKLRQEHHSVFPPIIVFDGVNSIYTTQRLAFKGPDWSAEVEVCDPEERLVKLKFRIQLVKTNIDLRAGVESIIRGGMAADRDMTEVQVLNIVLSQSARESCEVVGRNYFPESSVQGRVVDLPGGKTIWFGHFQAVNIGWKPFINVDVANKPAVKNSDMIGFMRTVLGRSG